jgi:hypothetical protein
MWARRYKARIVRRWIASLTSSRVRYMCAQLYERRRTPEGSFVPHTRTSARYVNMGPTFMFSVARARRCLFPQVAVLYCIPLLHSGPGVIDYPRGASFPGTPTQKTKV